MDNRNIIFFLEQLKHVSGQTLYHIEGIASPRYSDGHCVFFKESQPHKTVSSFSIDRLLVHIPSWLGWKFFGLYTLYLMPVVSSWVYNFLFFWRPVLKSFSLVVILTFCTTDSISPFFPFPLSWSLWSSARSQFWLFHSLELLELFANTRSMTLEISFPPETEKSPLVNQSFWA